MKIEAYLIPLEEEKKFLEQLEGNPLLVKCSRILNVNPLEQRVILDTGGMFDNLTEEERNYIRKAMENYLGLFCTNLISAVSLSLEIGSPEPMESIFKGLNIMGEELDKSIDLSKEKYS